VFDLHVISPAVRLLVMVPNLCCPVGVGIYLLWLWCQLSVALH
jgi:hypothetical protein